MFDTTIRLFRKVSVRFDIRNPDGTPFLEPTWLWFRSDRGGNWISVNNGTVLEEFTDDEGVTEPILPMLRYSAWGPQANIGARWFYGDSIDQIVPPVYPSNLQSVYTIIMTEYVPPATTTTIAQTTTTNVGPPATGTTSPPATTTTTTTTAPASPTTTTQPVTGM